MPTRVTSRFAPLGRRLPLLALLAFAACLCVASGSLSVPTELSSSSSGSTGDIVGDEDPFAGSSTSDGSASEHGLVVGDTTEEDTDAIDGNAAGVATDTATSVTSSYEGESMSASSSEDAEDGSNGINGELTVLTPIPTAVVGSPTFALVDSVTCDAKTVDTIEAVCSINRAMFDACVAASGYQIFPYSGVVPDADDITGLVSSASCMGIITAVVLLDMPACTVAQMPVRAVCETLLKISVDVAAGEAAPDAAEFHEVMAWRRDSDLAKQAGQPFDNASAIYADFARNLRVALTESRVTVLPNMTILIDDFEGEEIDMVNGVAAAFDMSLDYDFGTVEAADSSDDQATEPDSASEIVSALSSDAPRMASGPTMAIAALTVATHALVLAA